MNQSCESGETEHNCPLCDRPLGNVNIDEHHLIPKTFKGKEKDSVHRICHVKVHATFTERELANHYNTWERLREHEQIQKFIKWVSKKEPEFYDNSKWTNQRKGKNK